MGFVRSSSGICNIFVFCGSESDIKKKIKGLYAKSVSSNDGFKNIAKRINKYLKGLKISFDVKIDLSGYSDFEKAAYQIVSQIPKGQVRTYSWVAGRLGNENKRRAVGAAMAKNRNPIIIPCHRVVSSSGLGGFAFGTENKYRLLKLEGAVL